MQIRVNPMPAQIPAERLALLDGIDTTWVGHRRVRGFMDIALRPVIEPVRVLGTAVTLQIPDRDGAMLHHATGLLRPGDVLVIDRAGDRRYACLGGGVGHAIKASGAAGVVIDGPATDITELRALGLPVWHRGISPVTTRLLGQTGALNVAISCGGVPVNPGDLVLADENGILALDPGELDAVAAEARGRLPIPGKLESRLDAGEKLGDITGATRMILDALERE